MNEHRKFFIGYWLITLIAIPSVSQSQVSLDETGNLVSGESSLTVFNPHPSLFNDFKVDGYDYLEASLEVKEKAASVSWAPFLKTRNYSFWSETRVQLAQKDKQTSLGVSLKFNPLNPRSSNGRQVWADLNLQSDDGLGVNTAKEVRIAHLKNQVIVKLTKKRIDTCLDTLALFQENAEIYERDHDAAPDGALLKTFKCVLIKAHGTIEKLDNKIKELASEVGEDPSLANELKLKKEELTKWKKAYSTVHAAVERAYYVIHKQDAALTSLTKLKSEISMLTEELSKSRETWASANYLKYRTKLHSSKIPIVSMSYLNNYFETISGGRIDANDNGFNDNEHRIKSRVLSLSADWRISERDQISLLFSRSEERKTAEANSLLADYDGLGATWTRRLKILNKDGYTRTKDYKESLFVPSINAGIAYERKECDSPNDICVDGVIRSTALSPFIEFKVSKKAQFRLAVPFKRKKTFNAGKEGEEDSVELLALVAFQLGAPK